jgi:hypothetical protein
MTLPVSELRLLVEERKQQAQWEPAIETIMQLLDVETDPLLRATLSNDAAQICCDHLADLDRAIEYLDYAVDAYFFDAVRMDGGTLSAAMQTFRRLEGLLIENSRWRELDRAYRKMIVRMKPGGPSFNTLRAEMFTKCGELYRTRLDSPESAEVAFEEARKMDSTAAVKPSREDDADAPRWSGDPRLNDPQGLNMGIPADDNAAVTPPDIAALKEQLTHEHYALRFGAWDGLVAAFGLESVVRAPPGQQGKGSYMELLKDFLASDCTAFVRMGAAEICGILDKLAAGATPESLEIEWRPDPRPAVSERMVEALLDPQRAYPVEEILTLTDIPRRWAEASLALFAEKNDTRAVEALVQLDAVWTLPILEELAESSSVPADLREQLKLAVRDLRAS